MDTAEMSIKQTTESKGDFSMLGKVTGIDLRARVPRVLPKGLVR